ncbi:flavin reductase family protein [soil metagenome]
MRPDARATWPSSELIDSWLADSVYDFQLHPGEHLDVDPSSPESIAEARRFRDVLGRFASGITVVTAMSNGEPVGLTCQSFSSVSLNPPLVLFVPARTSRAWPRIQRAGKFCVNFLAEGQAELSNTMASRGADKFADVEWQPSRVTGSPVLPGTLGHVDCTIHTVHEAGDHYLVIGRVQELVAGDATGPLLFFQGKYRTTDG